MRNISIFYQKTGKRIRSRYHYFSKKKNNLNIGAIIVKDANDLSYSEILKVISRDFGKKVQEIPTGDAIFSNDVYLSIAYYNNSFIITGSSVKHSFSVDEEQGSRLDARLEGLDGSHEIICFIINSAADVYGISIYRAGKRVAAKCTSEGQTICDFAYNADLRIFNPLLSDENVEEAVIEFLGFNPFNIEPDELLQGVLYF